MSTPDYGRAFAFWRAAAGADWQAYTRHSFVQKLGDGTLPRHAYLYYLVQDYVFLIHFSRAWALAVVKSETLEEMKTAAAAVNGLVTFEMAHHVEICATEGITEDMLFTATESPTNLAYTRYVLDAGLSGDFADLMAALAPCALGYGEIGARLTGEATKDTPYREWINTYAGDEFQDLCRNTGKMIDAALERRIGTDFEASPRWARLNAHFTTATRLEADFWQMGLDGR